MTNGAARSAGFRSSPTCSPRRWPTTSRWAARRPARTAIARAAQAAGAAEFIEDLPQGYDTAVGERGLRLSSGQRQQIALARAFLRDAPLLLLDEPAAHLDAASARRLSQAVSTLMADRTVIQVIHGQDRSRGTGRVLLWRRAGCGQPPASRPGPPPLAVTS